MPLIPAPIEAQMRRHWQLVATAFGAVLFLAFHLSVFEVQARRHDRLLTRARQMGLAVDLRAAVAETPPRVLVLLAANMLPAGVTDVGRQATGMASSMLEEITQATARHGMEVLAAEPGLTSQETRTVQLRARLRVRCTYPQFVALLDDLAREPSLMSVDRFTMIESHDGRRTLDLWLTRYVLLPERRK